MILSIRLTDVRFTPDFFLTSSVFCAVVLKMKQHKKRDVKKYILKNGLIDVIIAVLIYNLINLEVKTLSLLSTVQKYIPRIKKSTES